jgi:hypothetical protein
MTLLLLFSGEPLVVDEPTVVTGAVSAISAIGATLEGNITNLGNGTVTRRGFQFANTPYPDREVYEDNAGFSTGVYTLPIADLYPGALYYYRAFAENEEGVGYGSWVAFSTISDTYNISIDGIDRTADIKHGSLSVDDQIDDQVNACTFSIKDLHSLGAPANDDEVIITLSDGTVLFGGTIVSFKMTSLKETGVVQYDIKCVDYTRELDRNLVHKTYEGMTDKEIIEDIVSTYCAGTGITTDNVVVGVTIDQIGFNYIQPSQCLRKIAELTGRHWYIDYEKDIHYFPLVTDTTPFNITASQNAHYNLELSKDASQIKNRVYVRGGTKLSDTTTYEEKGDGVKKKFPLPDKPHEVTVEVNGSPQTLGIKNIDTAGFDWYLNFQEKYLEQDAGGAVLTSSDTLEVSYKYDIPILVAVENTASIMEHGQYEFPIFDKTITTTQAARDRASAELTDYAANLVEGSFKTLTPGFRSGQYININHAAYDVNDNYIVQKVTAVGMGAGKYEYQITLASAKTLGIIKFLLELLENNRNLIEIDSNEVIDELLGVQDSLLGDSLTDALTIDSAGPYATWCTDSLQSTPTTRARWNLFQWG